MPYRVFPVFSLSCKNGSKKNVPLLPPKNVLKQEKSDLISDAWDRFNNG
jgi:hypothetical protein